jgi:hypothetical protein
MRRHRSLLALAAAALALGPLAGVAVAEDGPKTPADLKAAVIERSSAGKSRLTAGTTAAALPEGSVGNGIYRVYVEETSGRGIGAFTVLTGPQHPAGPGHDVLFGNGIPGTSYLALRQVGGFGPTDVTDYVQSPLITQESERPLDWDFDAIDLTETGYTATWDPWFGILRQTVEVRGTTLADTSIDVTTTLEPNGTMPDATFTVQYLWDVAAGADDGPVLQALAAGEQFRPFAPTRATEQTVTSVGLAFTDNDGTAAPRPSLAFSVVPTAADTVKYACWPQAIYAPVSEYEIDETYDIATTASSCLSSNQANDSAVISLWTRPGSSPFTVSQSLVPSPRPLYATALTATPVLLNPPVFSATLRDVTANRPLPGRTVQFVVGNAVRCSAVTDANGTARCGTLIDRLAAVLNLGYTARFTGNAIWSSTSARGRLL